LLNPDDADLDFGDRVFQRDAADPSVYLFNLDEGSSLSFRAEAHGYQSRRYEEELSTGADDNVMEIRVRLRRPEPRDPCVDPATGLRDPYCTQ
jgi:hypothetical protein